MARNACGGLHGEDVFRREALTGLEPFPNSSLRLLADTSGGGLAACDCDRSL